MTVATAAPIAMGTRFGYRLVAKRRSRSPMRFMAHKVVDVDDCPMTNPLIR